MQSEIRVGKSDERSILELAKEELAREDNSVGELKIGDAVYTKALSRRY